jgi:hypothetical protein
LIGMVRTTAINLYLIILGIMRKRAYISPLMKTLVIHPEDRSTDVLSNIYAGLQNKTVITCGVTKLELQKLIECNDRIIMLGHGSPSGLLSVDQFPCAGDYIIDDSMAGLLKQKSNNIYIWCNADQFVRRHLLSGMYCGMFISEIFEAFIYGFDNVQSAIIDESNELFALTIGKYINEPILVLYKKLMNKYGLLARANPIAKYNHVRIFLNNTGNL